MNHFSYCTKININSQNIIDIIRRNIILVDVCIMYLEILEASFYSLYLTIQYEI